MGDGFFGASGAAEAPSACSSPKKPSPELTGKNGVECEMMSVCCLRPFFSGRVKRIARPLGLAFGSVSGITGIPVEFEKRPITGVDGAFRWGAEDKEAASGVGLKVPLSRIPLACAEASVSRRNSLVCY